jgi:hypothetical protein
MALTLTKRVTTTWDGPTPSDPTYVTARDDLVARMISENKTDGLWTGNDDGSVGSRCFIAQASAEEFLTAIIAANGANRNLLSSEITDI